MFVIFIYTLLCSLIINRPIFSYLFLLFLALLFFEGDDSYTSILAYNDITMPSLILLATIFPISVGNISNVNFTIRQFVFWVLIILGFI